MIIHLPAAVKTVSLIGVYRQGQVKRVNCLRILFQNRADYALVVGSLVGFGVEFQRQGKVSNRLFVQGAGKISYTPVLVNQRTDSIYRVHVQNACVYRNCFLKLVLVMSGKSGKKQVVDGLCSDKVRSRQGEAVVLYHTGRACGEQNCLCSILDFSEKGIPPLAHFAIKLSLITAYLLKNNIRKGKAGVYRRELAPERGIKGGELGLVNQFVFYLRPGILHNRANLNFGALTAGNFPIFYYIFRDFYRKMDRIVAKFPQSMIHPLALHGNNG
jgi:hypothetical protein